MVAQDQIMLLSVVVGEVAGAMVELTTMVGKTKVVVVFMIFKTMAWGRRVDDTIKSVQTTPFIKI